MGGQSRFSLSGIGACYQNRVQPALEVGEKNGVAQCSYGLIEFGSYMVSPFLLSALRKVSDKASAGTGSHAFRELRRKAIEGYHPNHIYAEIAAGLLRIAKCGIKRIQQQRSAESPGELKRTMP